MDKLAFMAHMNLAVADKIRKVNSCCNVTASHYALKEKRDKSGSLQLFCLRFMITAAVKTGVERYRGENEM